MAWVPRAAEDYLAGLTAANRRLMSRGAFPPLYSTGMNWSLGDVGVIPLAHTILRRGRAACGPLAAYRAAELQRAGENARAVVIPSPSGIAGRWHAVVRRANGTLEDPSKILRAKAVLGFGWGGLKRAGMALATGGQSEAERSGLGISAGLKQQTGLDFSGPLGQLARGKMPGGGESDGKPSGKPSGYAETGVKRAPARLRVPLAPGSAASIEIPLALVGGGWRTLRLSARGPRRMRALVGVASRLASGPLGGMMHPRTRLAIKAARAAHILGGNLVADVLCRGGLSDIARQVRAFNA